MRFLRYTEKLPRSVPWPARPVAIWTGPRTILPFRANQASCLESETQAAAVGVHGSPCACEGFIAAAVVAAAVVVAQPRASAIAAAELTRSREACGRWRIWGMRGRTDIRRKRLSPAS